MTYWMKESLKAGLSMEYTMTVNDEMTTTHLGKEVTRVYSTPSMIYHMENVCTLMLEPHLNDGEQSVGTEVNVKHIAATPMGMKVTTRAVLREIDGRRCRFDVESLDEREKVGEGIHERFIIDINRFDSKLKAKKG